MKFIDLFRMSSSSLWKRKIRTILTVIGVVIGTASIVVMISLGLGLNKQTMEDIEKYGGLTTINVFTAGSGYSEEGGDSVGKEVKYLDDELVKTIASMPYVEMVSPVLNADVMLKTGVYKAEYVTFQGYSLDALSEMKLDMAEGALPKTGEPLKLIYGNHVLDNFSNEKTGESVDLTKEPKEIDLMKNPVFVIYDMDAYWASQNASNPDNQFSFSGENEGGTTGDEEPKKPPKKYVTEGTAILAGGADDYDNNSFNVLCDIEALKIQLKKVFKNKQIPGQPTTKNGKPFKVIYYNSLYVKVDSMEHVKEVQSSIKDMGYEPNSNAEWVEQMQSQQRSIQAVLGGIGAVSLLVAAIGIANTMMMSIYERTKEIGVMKVLGCGLGNIRSMFMIEAAYIGFIGGVAGLVLSYITSAIINNITSKMYGYETATSYIPIWLSLLSLIFAVFVGMAAGFFPARRAMKLSPLAAIRNE